MGWWRNPLIIGACGLLLLRTILSFRQLLALAVRLWKATEDALHCHQTYKIPLYNDKFQENPLHRKALSYIATLPSLEDSTDALLFSRRSNGPRDLYLQLDVNQTVQDSFLGAKLSWTNLAGETLVLSVRKHDRRRVLRPYLQHIEAVADEVDLRRRDVRLFTNSTTGAHGRRWKSVAFTHPATLDTLAMDVDLKNRVRSDLESFLKNKSYYNRLGRVWKRSYLLYGPPGTGKSSFIAAMAKFLSYDIYDLDLARVTDGSDLKNLLLQTNPRSVIVVEDLDCFLKGGPNWVSSGVAGFMDGVFSCCGEERVMVFTMRETSVTGLDPALLRPGRLDVHLYFPLCDFLAFKTMASCYLGLKDHKLYPTLEEVFQLGATMSHAEVGEIMIANKSSPSRALRNVISALQQGSRRVGGLLGTIGVKRGQVGPGWVGEEEEEEVGETGGGVINKEIKKLYGMIRLRGSKKDLQPPPTPKGRHRKQMSSSSSLDIPVAVLENGKTSPPAS